MNLSCPYSHRVMMAAIEKLGMNGFVAYQIDLDNKPKWYKSINEK